MLGDIDARPLVAAANALAPTSLADALPINQLQERLIDSFLAGRKPTTVAAYRRDLEDFRAFVAKQPVAAAYASSVDRVTREFFSLASGQANGLALGYRADLLARGLSPATVNRRLAALRSLVQLGRTLGLVGWELEIQNVGAAAYRDTRGPGHAGAMAIIAQAEDRGDRKGVRDLAIVRLLHNTALRRGEVVSLDLEHYDASTGTLAILGKGRRQRETVTMPDATLDALDAWIAARGSWTGPLFCRLDNAGLYEGRLTGEAVRLIVRRLGAGAGVPARPHGLRHAAITEALARTNGNVSAVQSFARHRDPRVTMLYNDSRDDQAGQIAKLIAED